MNNVKLKLNWNGKGLQISWIVVQIFVSIFSHTYAVTVPETAIRQIYSWFHMKNHPTLQNRVVSIDQCWRLVIA